MINSARIVRSRRRTLALIVTRDAQLVIRAPIRITMGEIERFVTEKEAWIRRKICEISARAKPQPKQFIDGEEFFYLGNKYPLSIVEDSDESLSLDNHFRLARRDHGSAQDIFTGWYRAVSRSEIKTRLDRYSALSGLIHDRFKITGARSKWGSCSGRANLCFSWRLVMAPPHVVDYVVVHELAHIAHKNHSKAFWDTVAGIFPDYKKSEKWLKANGHMLVL